MAIDIAGLSSRELDALIAKAKQRKTILKKRKPIATVRNKLVAVALAEGYSLSELFNDGKGRGTPAAAPKAPARKGRKLGKVAPKYRNPANPKETWTGRGKQPRWLAALVAQGKKRDEFLIGSAGGKASTAKRSTKRSAVRKTARKASNATGKRARKAPSKAVRKASRKKS